MKASEIFAVLKKDGILLEISGLPPEVDISGIAYESGKVKNGFVFAAALGAVTDGHNYIPEAIRNGAFLILCEKREAYETYKQAYPECFFVLTQNTRRALALLSAAFFGYPAEKLKLIGLTGTKGKTSTSFMLRSILEAADIPTGLIGTTGIYYGEHYEYIDNSTPESYELQRIFADMVKCGMKMCVMEVSSQALKLDRVYGLRFDTAVFTNISPDHIGKGEHEDFEEYLACKGELFRMCERAAINADSDRIDYITDILKERHVPYVTYSCKNNAADFYGYQENFYMENGDMKTEYTLRCAKGEERVFVGVPGKFSVYNSLCALSVAAFYEIPFSLSFPALEKVHVIGRTEPVKHPKGKVPVIIDYAHNALSLQSLFDAVRAYHPKRIICVFGAGGNRSRVRRFDMGEIAGKNADLSVITSDNPRDEDIGTIISDILWGIAKTEGRYAVIKDRAEAIRYALEHAEEGDIVLLAGKGQQKFEEIRGVKYPFDERQVVKDFYDAL